jgi:glycosyltransferase involved in cell wall biosynthesis
MTRESATAADTVSVIIPTHLRAGLLPEAIASALEQTRAPHEIIVVDDADDPATREIVQSAARRGAPPVIYLANRDRPGACGSRNHGASNASGNLIAFLDDDDVWRPQFLEETLRAMDRSGAHFVMCGLYRHDESRAPELRVTPANLTPLNVVEDPRSMTGSNVLYRKSAFERVGGFDPSVTVFNDWDLFIRLVDSGCRYEVVPLGLADWRWHSGDRIATFSLKRARGLRYFLAKYGHRMKKRTYRDFHTTAIGIERRHAAGIKRFWKSAELFVAHGVRNSVARLLGTS